MLVGTAMTNLCLESGHAKLIVSVSLGSSAVFRWRRQSCLDDEGHLCCLGHGDILVMDGHVIRTSSLIVRILAGNRNGSTLRSVGSNNMFPHVLCLRTVSGMLFANVCAGFISFCYGELGDLAVFGLHGFSLVPCRILGGCLALLVYTPVVYRVLGHIRSCLLLDKPFGWRSVSALPL